MVRRYDQFNFFSQPKSKSEGAEPGGGQGPLAARAGVARGGVEKGGGEKGGGGGGMPILPPQWGNTKGSNTPSKGSVDTLINLNKCKRVI